MGRFALLIVASLILSYGVSNLSLNNLLTIGVENSSSVFSRTHARNVGKSMTNILKAQLSTNKNWREANPVSTTLMDAAINYTIKDTILSMADTLVKITVNANYSEQNHQTIEYVKIPSITVSPDSFLTYALVTDQNMDISGSDFFIGDYNNPQFNANIHSNNQITTSGISGLVEGFLSYTIANNFPSGMVIPNFNPDSDPNIEQRSAINIPNIVPSDYLAMADEVYNSDKTFTGTLALGTLSNPKVIYVTGKLSLNATISGYGIFIAENDIILNGNMNVTDINNDEVLILTSRNIICSGSTATVYAHLVANGNLSVNNSDLSIYGSVATSGNISISHTTTLNLYYIPITPNFIEPIGFAKKIGAASNDRIKTVWVYE